MIFDELNLAPNILKAVSAEGYESPSEIQEAAIPPLLMGKDLIGCAQTGTGKTAAFALPIIHLLQERGISPQRKIRSLILTPTRELAMQIFESFHAYGRYTKLKYGVIFGGVSQRPQETMLKKGIDVLVATPGRLNDLINQGLVHLGDLEIFVLDEADRMLDMGFIHDVKKIIHQLPSQKQTLLFSATMPQEIREIAGSMMNEPEKIAVKPVSSTVDTISQKIYFVDKDNKQDLLIHLLAEKKPASTLVFTRTKHGADKVVRKLIAAGIKAAAIHGNKSQNNRQEALNSFKSGSIKVLVATDIAARGIDVDKLSLVVNFDLPNIPETYVHRIGRTGRAGHEGESLSFCDSSEKPYLKDIEKLIKKQIEVNPQHPYPMLQFEPVPVNQDRRRQQPRAPHRQERRSGGAQRPKSRQEPEHKSRAEAPAARSSRLKHEGRKTESPKSSQKPGQSRSQGDFRAEAPVRGTKSPSMVHSSHSSDRRQKPQDAPITGSARLSTKK